MIYDTLLSRTLNLPRTPAFLHPFILAKKVEGTTDKYTVFTVPQNIDTNYWEYNGEKPIMNLGVMPAFCSAASGGEIVYNRFYHVYLPGYIISLITLVFIAWYWLRKET